MRIAIAGGTGTVGAHIAAAAERAGHETVVLARSRGVDVLTGEGLPAALDGADVVVDALSVNTLSAKASVRFFTTASQRLLEAEAAAGTPHHLALSIVGVDRAPHDYYAGKLAQERVVERSDIPWAIVRATQFHEFAAQMYSRAAVGPVHLAPRMRTQPIAAREVAEHVVALAAAGPVGRADDLAGPREESLVRMIRAYAASRGASTFIPAVPLPGKMGKAQRDGTLLPGSGAVLGRQSFDEWLASSVAGPGAPSPTAR